MRHRLSILPLLLAAGLLRAQAASGPFVQAFPTAPTRGLKDQVDGRMGFGLAGGWWSENDTLPFRARVLVQAWPRGPVRDLPGTSSRVGNAAVALEMVSEGAPESRIYGAVGLAADHWVVEVPGVPAVRTTHLSGTAAIGYRLPNGLFFEIASKRGAFLAGAEAETLSLSAGYRFGSLR